MTEDEVKQIIRDELQGFILTNKYTFQKPIQIFDGRSIQFGTTNGTKIGTGTTQKLSFYGVTPVDQPDTIADPSGGATVDAAARAAINSLIDRLQELGLIA